MTAQLLLTVHAFTLQLLLESAESLIDVVVPDENLHKKSHLTVVTGPNPDCRARPLAHDQNRGNTYKLKYKKGRFPIGIGI